MSGLVALPLSDKLSFEDQHSTKWRRRMTTLHGEGVHGSHKCSTDTTPFIRIVRPLSSHRSFAYGSVRFRFEGRTASLSRDSYAGEQVQVL